MAPTTPCPQEQLHLTVGGNFGRPRMAVRSATNVLAQGGGGYVQGYLIGIKGQGELNFLGVGAAAGAPGPPLQERHLAALFLTVQDYVPF